MAELTKEMYDLIKLKETDPVTYEAAMRYNKIIDDYITEEIKKKWLNVDDWDFPAFAYSSWQKYQENYQNVGLASDIIDMDIILDAIIEWHEEWKIEKNFDKIEELLEELKEVFISVGYHEKTFDVLIVKKKEEKPEK